MTNDPKKAAFPDSFLFWNKLLQTWFFPKSVAKQHVTQCLHLLRANVNPQMPLDSALPPQTDLYDIKLLDNPRSMWAFLHKTPHTIPP